EERHKDIAAGLQKITNDVIMSLADHLFNETKSTNICRAGGVALNCVTNSFLHEFGPFDNTFIQPAANDMGTALGAAYYIWNQILENKQSYIFTHPYIGPSFSDVSIEQALGEAGAQFTKLTNPEKTAAALIADGMVVAWFQGGMEFGPRALGNRSILADPRRFNVISALNETVKHRDYFRPFASSVLEEKAHEWFDIEKDTISDRYMLLSRRIRIDKICKIPGVSHVDGTSRIQTVNKEINHSFYNLMSEFEKMTGIPIVLNTSFNDQEPIVCSPKEALKTCLKTNVDYLIIGEYLIDFGRSKYNASFFSDTDSFSEQAGFLMRLQTDFDFREHFCKTSDAILVRDKDAQEMFGAVGEMLHIIKEKMGRFMVEFKFCPNSTAIKDYIVSRR
ncbi:MAG: hypothetical protein HQK96_11730, partial [Nitrospirae bacterium]|nr:hypothetical protein [Nitrospirota bacterium]